LKLEKIIQDGKTSNQDFVPVELKKLLQTVSEELKKANIDYAKWQMVETSHNQGLEYFRNEEYSLAYSFFEIGAKLQYPDSFFYLGVIFYHGYGISQNSRLARKYFEKAVFTGFKDPDQLLQYYIDIMNIEDVDTIQSRNVNQKLESIGLSHSLQYDKKDQASITRLLGQYPDRGEDLATILTMLIEERILSEEFFSLLRICSHLCD